MAAATHTYLIGLGSNRRGRHGAPAAEVSAALAALAGVGRVVAAAPVSATAPLGPSRRAFANAAAALASAEAPPALLARLKGLERAFGRRPGRRWGARVIDLDILFWSGGRWRARDLAVPHPAAATRRFVLDPLMSIAPGWRDPASGLAVRHLRHRLTRRRPLG